VTAPLPTGHLGGGRVLRGEEGREEDGMRGPPPVQGLHHGADRRPTGDPRRRPEAGRHVDGP
jgi:hypothetical protein